jgi:hypothetical protein
MFTFSMIAIGMKNQNHRQMVRLIGVWPGNMNNLFGLKLWFKQIPAGEINNQQIFLPF